jgi:hypothetical protein
MTAALSVGQAAYICVDLAGRFGHSVFTFLVFGVEMARAGMDVPE